MEFGFQKPACGDFEATKPPDWWYELVDKVHYLHFGILLWFISGLVAVVVSLMTPPPPEDSLHRLTFWSRHSHQVRLDNDGGEDKLGDQEQKPRRKLNIVLCYIMSIHWVSGKQFKCEFNGQLKHHERSKIEST